MSDDARRTGRVDFTGTLTIVAIKLTSLAMDYQDGLKALKDDAKRAKDGEKPESEQPSRDDRRKAEKRARVIREMPSLVEFLGCGPRRCAPPRPSRPSSACSSKAHWQQPSSSSSSRTLDLSLATDPARFFVLPFLRRLLLVFHATLVAASGAERQVASWDRARNVNILGMELASTGADVAKNWNISFSTWLRICNAKESALFNLLFTFFISAISHGLNLGDLIGFAHWALMIAGSRVIYRWPFPLSQSSLGLNPGDLIGFAHWALMIAGSRVIYRWSRPLAQGSLPRRAASLLHFLYVLLCINYAGFGFSVMTFQHTVQAYRGLYYYGTLVPVMLIVAGNFIRTPRPRGAKKSLKTE
ncbi:unnamed protein product [Closterium sp. NIES-65]|nr:unnamed protein product [Closterium sp. NIES-65]